VINFMGVKPLLHRSYSSFSDPYFSLAANNKTLTRDNLTKRKSLNMTCLFCNELVKDLFFSVV
jgi:hypothetical protein